VPPSLRHINGVERILPKGQNTLVFWLNGRNVSSTTSSLQWLRSRIELADSEMDLFADC
jgi:hypothetical protein